MAEVAGLALGVLALWQSCVSVFDVIDSSRRYGMDYELLCVKLEVERVRLLCWGDAVGLNNASSPSPTPDPRFGRVEVRSTVIRLLGAMQQVFENSERLQEVYGLRPYSAEALAGGNEIQISQSQLILGGVFKRAYQNLRKMAQERQRGTVLARKTLWAVYDRKKFAELVVEIREFNDSLASLFPDAKARAAEGMRVEIDESVQVDQLRLLQDAMIDEHEELSEVASVRLEALGVTVSARTELLSLTEEQMDALTVTGADDDVEEVPREAPEGTAGQAAAGEEEPLDEVSKKLMDLEAYVGKRSTGALTLSIIGPQSYSEHVSAHVYFDRDTRDSSFSRIWDERDKGFVLMQHASFELYRKKKYMRKRHREKDSYESLDSEDYTLFDAEAQPKYENINPGTVTVEGFGIECWDFEMTKPRNKTIFVNHAEMPNVSAAKLLRRLDELRRGGDKIGWSPDEDELDIKEFVGTLGIVYYDQKYARDPKRWVGDLYSVLNRTDIFADFTSSSSVGLQWAGPERDGRIGYWNLLWQIIIAKELARRLDSNEDNGYTGFTERILASMIISDLWLTNVGLILTDEKIDTSTIKVPETEAEKEKAEEFKNKGNAALQKKQYQVAIDLYTAAIKIDLGNAVYRCNRSAASFSKEMFEEAEEDAYIAAQLDPKYAKAWSRLGAARLQLGKVKKAREAYQRALAVAGKDATNQMRRGLEDVEAKIKEVIKEINEEKDREKRHGLRSKFHDQDWDILGKKVEMHSSVHERQVEGLLLFAERMKWPFINEVRDYAEDVYTNLRGGETIDIHLHDWLFGLVLPGKWFSFKIMTALIMCTKPVKDIGAAHYYECGLSLPKRSYWRSRTVLGRVLGCLPGVISLCGWIGPCPPVEFEGPTSSSPNGENKKPKHIRISTRRLAPHEHKPNDENSVINIGSEDKYEATRIRADEEIGPYLEDMQDSSRWIIPAPPVQEISTCKLLSIRLKKLPLNIAHKPSSSQAGGELDLDEEREVENETQYRASLVFKLDSSTEPVTYKLFTNPVFVTLPPCKPGPKGPHEVHMRELPRYQTNIWTVEQLKDHTAEEGEAMEAVAGSPMIINATGEGAEVLARAWCSERGKNAVVRKKGGPCFVCAVRAAGVTSLGTRVLIWLE
ncbi:hypothetical protein V494_03966 [Pseudogymnoascus sp. VKM F-4513 (FW-928)]|nr:hypothetical protein V494_03966 [Pseudogymnoascus sp. VKM F-4513 (FW-928)]